MDVSQIARSIVERAIGEPLTKKQLKTLKPRLSPGGVEKQAVN